MSRKQHHVGCVSVRVLAVLLIVSLSADHAAVFAVENAADAIKIGIWLIKDSLRSSLISKQISHRSFDPSAQASQVHHFRICPRKLVLYQGESFTLVPIPLDRNKEVVHGVAAVWDTKDARVAEITSVGEVTGLAPGRTQVEVRARSAEAKVNVEVRPGARPQYTDRKKADNDWDVEHGRDCETPDVDPVEERGATVVEQDRSDPALSQPAQKPTSSRLTAANTLSTVGITSRARRAPMRSFSNTAAAEIRNARLAQPVSPVPTALPQFAPILDGDSADTTSTTSIAPHNAVGQPRLSAVEFSQASAAKTKNNLGSFNYSFSAPVLALGGRGLGVGLALTYNSRVWNRESDGKMTFNYQKGWPAPGWTLGYGRLIDNYDGLGNWLLIQPDGTRIHLQSQTGSNTLTSREGSFIIFNKLNGKLRYTDGTLVTFSLVNNRWLPVSIRTNNGDLLTIAYKNFVKQQADPNYFPFRWAIDSIIDTLGRVVKFNYDPATKRVVSITTKDRGGSTDRVLCQIDYTDITLQYNFGPSVQVTAPASGSLLTVVRRLYYPATGRGYVLSDYSSYGMARRVSMRIGMTAASDGSGDGIETAYTRYDYTSITDQVGQLSDSPQYTHRFEWWQNKIDGTAETAYTYSRITETDPIFGEIEKTKVTQPNGLEVITWSGSDQGDAQDFGHVVRTEIKSGSTILRSSQQTYLTDSSGGQQVSESTSTDEAGNTVKTTYDYLPSFGRVQNINEFGFTSSIQRRTKFAYSDDAGLLNQNMVNVVTSAEVRNGAGQLIAKTNYEIDNYSVNPLLDYSVTAPNHDYTNYGVNDTSRGNVTAVTVNVTPTGPTITRRTKYDVFGNAIEAEVNCCNVKTAMFDQFTWFSQPASTTDGRPAQTPHLTSSFDYDFSTGLLLNSTDPNGRSTSYDYDSAWRPLSVTAPTGAVTTTQFDKDANQHDLLSYVQQAIYIDGNVTKSITSRSWFDGGGRVIRAGTGAGTSPASYDAVSTEYDTMGRVQRQSNPYVGNSSGIGSPAFWSVNTYDPLSRVTTVTLPDNQTIQTIYNGAITTVIDQVGRQRSSQVDGLGRLISVTEQDPASGALSLGTSYTYDIFDNLIGVNQGGQTRSFSYDSLSRLTSQTTPEGGIVNFTYTDFGAVQKRTDARGVEAHYKYDTLNRPTKIWYTGLGGDDLGNNRPALPSSVAATSDIDITYNTAAPGNGAVASVIDGQGISGFSTSESYVYDLFGRVISKTRTIDATAFQTQYQYNQASQLTVMIYPSTKRVQMNYDPRGRLVGEDRVTAGGAPLASYFSNINYNVAGQITGITLGNGLNETFGYSNDRLQLTQQTVKRGTTTLMDLSYGYQAGVGQSGSNTTAGNSGQLMTITGTINGQLRSQSFSYDNVARLVTATGWNVWQRRFDYDRWGNRTGMWDATSGGNQIQSITLQQQAGVPTNRIAKVNGVSHTYDAAGNLTNDGAHIYTYDAENRVTKVDGGNTAIYNYDSSNWRVKKQTTDGITYYVWEGAKVIAEYSTVPQQGTGGARFYHPDRLSNRLITDASSAVKGTMDHLPFGEEGGVTGESERHRFTTYERDGESGTDYAVNRQYLMNTGRFNRPDPVTGNIINPQSLNRYAYTMNDPTNLIDPLGLYTICFGYHVFYLTVDRNTGEILSESYGGFIATACFEIGGDPQGNGGVLGVQVRKEIKKDCQVTTTFDQLSSQQQALLPGGANQFNQLNDRQKGAFLTITAALGAANVSLAGLQVTDVGKDKVSFVSSSSSPNSLSNTNNSIQAGGQFTTDKPLASQHRNYSDFGYRQNGTRNSVSLRESGVTFLKM